MSRPPKFPEQFREDAVELARSSDLPLQQVAHELGVNHEALRNWVRTAQRAEDTSPGSVSAREQDELRALRHGCCSLSASGSRYAPTLKAHKATLSLELQHLSSEGWTTVNTGTKTIKPNQTGRRATASVPCSTDALGQWRSVLDVDIDWMIDDSRKTVSSVQTRTCRP